MAKELKAAKDWSTAQNQLGQPIGVKYVIKEKVVTGKDATVDALKAAYDDAKAQMDNEALVPRSDDANWISSKNRFIKAWADIKQSYSRFFANEDAEKAAKVNKLTMT